MKEYIHTKEELVSKLSGRCHQLELRHDILKIAEEAKELALSSLLRPQNEVAKEAHSLKHRIDLFLDHHRPSQENIHFLKFAKTCIQEAEYSPPSLQKVVSLDLFRKEEVTLDSFDLGETLYMLAEMLYNGEIHAFHAHYHQNLPKATKEEIFYHISLCEGNLDTLENRENQLKIIQGLLGYAHLLNDYYTDDTPYPTLSQIHDIFRDLAFIHYVEETEEPPSSLS